MKKQIFLADIDGTLALMDGRGPFEWDRVGEDKPNKPVLTVIQALIACDHEVGYVTGRMEQCRATTYDWLVRNVGREIQSANLWMRADGDYRPDEIVKREIYENEIAPHYEILGVFDDRARVVRAWRELGLTCFAVADGNF